MTHPNKTQLAIFELVRAASFNGFDGERVVSSLTDHPDYWESAYMTDGYHNGGLTLRDMRHNVWHVDTLYLLAREGQEQNLYNLAQTWDADEIDWLADPGSFLGSWNERTRKAGAQIVLRVWWD